MGAAAILLTASCSTPKPVRTGLADEAGTRYENAADRLKAAQDAAQSEQARIQRARKHFDAALEASPNSRGRVLLSFAEPIEAEHVLSGAVSADIQLDALFTWMEASPESIAIFFAGSTASPGPMQVGICLQSGRDTSQTLPIESEH